MEFRILGPLEVHDGERLLALGGLKQRSLLAILLLHANEVVSSDRLVDELWGENAPPTALKGLQVYISQLRKVLEHEPEEERVLVTRPPGYVIQVDGDQLDLARFERMRAEAEQALAERNQAEASAKLLEALALWRGAPLADFSYERFAQAEIGRLEELRTTVLEERIEIDLELGRHADLVGELQALIAAHPLRERLRRALMLALYRSGRQAEALEAYAETRRAFVEELGIEPSRELSDLQQAILAHDPSLTGAARTAEPVASAPGRGARSASRAALVAFLFTDLVGSTELLELFGEEAAGDMRRTHFRLLRDAVRTHGGAEVKNLGDGLLVVFESAVQAIRCAVTIQQAVDRHNERKASSRLQVRVGLNAGEPMQDEDDYFGTSVVIAKRLCDAAQGGQILASELVRGLVGSRGSFEFHALGELALKGVTQPLAASEVGWAPVSSQAIALPPVIAAAARTSLVGRQEPLARMTSEWERARSGERRLLLLAGEPGIGKTRLTAEFCVARHAEGATVMFGRSDEEPLIPYQPFVEALHHYCTACPLDELRTEVETRASDLQRLVPELSERLPNLPAPLRGEPEAERYRLFEAVASLVTEASATRPVVLVLDDLHWADKATMLLLKHLLRAPEQSSVLVLGTYRDAELASGDPLAQALADLRRDHLVNRISLKGLEETAVSELLAAIAGQDVPPELARAIHQESEGNPFFIEEIARHLSETGAVYRKDGQWTTDLSIAEIGIPEGVKDVIGSRVSRLEEPVVRVLTSAAVLGRDFGLDILEELAQRDQDQLAELLEPALAAQLVEEEPGAVGRYRFSHALVRETLYQQLSAARRAGLHRKIGEALERLHTDQPDQHLAELAQHFLEAAPGGETDKAIEYAQRAGDHAIAVLAYEEAARLYALALRALDLQGGEAGEQRCALLVALGDARARAGDEPGAQKAFLDAAAIAARAGLPVQHARAALGYGGRFVWARAYNDVHLIPLLEAALQALPPDASALRVKLMARLSGALRDHPSRERRASLSAQAVELARRLGDPATLAYALDGHYSAIMWPETSEERLAIANELVELAQQVADDERATAGRVYRVIANMELGRMTDAETELRIIAEDALALRQPAQLWITAASRANFALFRGNFDEAEALIEEALTLGEHAQRRDAVLSHRLQLFVLHREIGVNAAIEELIERAVWDFPTRPVFRCALAYIHADRGRAGRAQAAIEDLSSQDFAAIQRDNEYLFSLAFVADAVDTLGDVRAAAVLYDLLVPYAHLNAVNSDEVATGSVSRTLGVLAAMMARWDDAARHFDAAIVHNTDTGARPWLAHTQHDYARMLLERNERDDGERAQDLLTRAGTTYLQLGMKTWAGKAMALATRREPGRA